MPTSPDTRVCPRCGFPAGSYEYCQTCGLPLFEQPELPTRAGWESGSTRPPVTSPQRARSQLTGRKNTWWLVAGAVAVGLIILTFSSSNEPDVAFIERTVSSEQNGGFPVDCEAGDTYDAVDTLNGSSASYTCYGETEGYWRSPSARVWEVTVDSGTGEFRYDRVR
jgi:hypothetical protein